MASKVYFSSEITPEKVPELYRKLEIALPGRVAAKDDPGQPHLLQRMESRNGLLTIEAAAALGAGGKEYELIEL